MRFLPAVGILISLGFAGGAPDDGQPVQQPAAESSQRQASSKLLPHGPTQDDFPHLQNLLQVTERIYSGGQPHDDEAFAELAALGVKTIVSVDGARPDVETADEFGMRYVHIPIGYDGISDHAGRSLARLAEEIDGPVYVHCHHGNHRGPAAAAILSIVEGCADNDSASEILKRAGTSANYAGLWRDVAAFTPPPASAQLPELVPIAEVPSLAAAMAQIDRASDNLKQCAEADWSTPKNHPDLEPAQEALLLKEGLRETVRQLVKKNDRDQRFIDWMRDAEQSSERMEAALQSGDRQETSAAFTKLQEQCQQCHRAYRN